MKQKLKQGRDWIEQRLRTLCCGLSPEKRLIAILSMCLIFGIASIWIFVSSICQIGKKDVQEIKIGHIQPPEMIRLNDSINVPKHQLYEQLQSTDDRE